MDAKRPYTKVFVLVTVIVAVLVSAHAACQVGSTAVAADTKQPGIKDPALASIETNVKLDEVIEQLKQLNSKTQALHDLIKSGGVRVIVIEGPVGPAEGRK
jgi:hypothetical protein